MIPVIIDGAYDHTCPRRPILDDPDTYDFLFNAYAHYQNGYLLEDGSVLDQPAKLMKMLATISRVVVECGEEKQRVERERQAHHRRAEAQMKERGRGGVQ